MEIRPVAAELFRADRRTDMTKLIVAFRKFANAPKIVKYITYKNQLNEHSVYICCDMKETTKKNTTFISESCKCI